MTKGANHDRTATSAGAPSILTSWARAIVRALDARGIDGARLAAAAGLEVETIAGAETRSPLTATSHLWRLALDATEDPCFGLFVSRFVTYTTFHALGAAVLASATVKEAFTRLVRYSRVVSDAGTFRLEDLRDRYRVVLDVARGPHRPVDAAIDAFVSLQLRVVRTLLDRRDVNPLAVALERQEPAPSEPFRRFFRAPIVFGAPANTMDFARTDVERPLAAGSADLARRFDEVLARYLARFDRQAIASRVRTMVVERLPDGEPTQEAVGRALGMSARTLQRRLAGDGTSFHDLLNATRQELAGAYLAEGWSVTEIAFTLGFADASSFSRAYRRWTGHPPTALARRT